MNTKLIVLSAFLFALISCGPNKSGELSRLIKDCGEIRPVRGLTDELRVLLLSKSDSLLFKDGHSADNYNKHIEENDCLYVITYESKSTTMLGDIAWVYISKSKLEIIHLTRGE